MRSALEGPGTGYATRLTVDLFAADVRVTAWRAVSWITASIAQRTERVLPLCVSGASAVPSAVTIWLLVSQAARYSEQRAQRDRLIDLHRPRTSTRRAARDGPLEPLRLDERQVLHGPRQVGARCDGATPGILVAETRAS